MSLVLFSPVPLRAQDRFEAFGGYSFFRASVTETGLVCTPAGPACSFQPFKSHPDLNGWEGTVAYKPVKKIGVVADFGGYYGSLPTGGGSKHINTYLFGPQVSFPTRVSPFVHVLAGVAHESTGTGFTGAIAFPAHSSNAFAIALGAGIDIKVVPFVWVRLLQVDYLASHFVSSFQNQQRVSTGVVFHF